MKNFLRRLACVALLCLSGCWLSPEVAAQIPAGRCTFSRDLEVSAAASPDLDSSHAGIQVKIGTRVQLSGTSRVTSQLVDCSVTDALASLAWSLSFQPAGGEETDITSSLGPQTTQTLDTPSLTSFTATAEGTYRARVRGTAPNLTPETDLVVVQVLPPPAGLIQSCGRISFLLGNDVGSGFGPPNDFIDVEVITKLNTQPPARAMGFQLRNDANEPVRHGMLDLLRDAFNNNTNVCLDYFLVPGRNNGVIIRVALNK
jgi:hypothetical protein